jgi:hypothetical protein
MAALITEPNVDRAEHQDWLDLIARTTKQGGGFICLEITNIENSQKPVIVAGSRLEVNGGFYKVGPSNEAVSGTPTTPAWDKNNYIYAVPSVAVSTVPVPNGEPPSASITFQFSDGNDEPTWNASLGGWYSGNKRAIVKFFYFTYNNGSRYSGKVILDSYNAMFMVNTKQTDMDAYTVKSAFLYGSGGTSGNEGSVNTSINIPPGIYYYIIRGGSSGAGGAGGLGGDGFPKGQKGNDGTGGQWVDEITGYLRHHGGHIRVRVGADGGAGGAGGNGAHGAPGAGGAGGAGGGGGSGRDSAIAGIIARGGPPGRGGLGLTGVPSPTDQPQPHGENGGYIIGGSGCAGTKAAGIATPGEAGSRGPTSTTSTNGYARLYRVG